MNPPVMPRRAAPGTVLTAASACSMGAANPIQLAAVAALRVKYAMHKRGFVSVIWAAVTGAARARYATPLRTHQPVVNVFAIQPAVVAVLLVKPATPTSSPRPVVSAAAILPVAVAVRRVWSVMMILPLPGVVSARLRSVAVVPRALFVILRPVYVFATIPAAAGVQREQPAIPMQTPRPAANVCVIPAAVVTVLPEPYAIRIRIPTAAAFAEWIPRAESRVIATRIAAPAPTNQSARA